MLCLLMFEVTDTRHYHCYTQLVCRCDTIGISYRAPRLCDCCDPGLRSKGDTVIKGEESITREYSSMQIKTKMSSLLNRLL